MHNNNYLILNGLASYLFYIRDKIYIFNIIILYYKS